MARLQGVIEIDKASWDAADAILEKIAMVVRGPTIDKSLRKVGNAIKSQTKAILPKPGYPGDKPGLKPLRETLKVKVKSYRGGEIKVMVVGYTYSRTPGEGGNHGHLLEGGHDMVVGGPKGKGGEVVGYVQPYEYMITVVETTKAQQQANFVTSVQRSLVV